MTQFVVREVEYGGGVDGLFKWPYNTYMLKQKGLLK
jgi:hypothetical protein